MNCIIKTSKGYLKGSKNAVGGSEPEFTKNKSEAKIIADTEVELYASYHCIREYEKETSL